MTKDKLKKEAEDYAEQCYGWTNNDQVTDVAIATYITSAEPREKRIEELEQKLEQTEKDLADYQFNYPTIKELTKENAELKADNDARKFAMAMSEKVEKQLREEIAELKEKLESVEKARDYWKDSSFDWRHKCTSKKHFRAAVKAQKQLTKAKEHIQTLISCLIDWVQEGDKDYCHIADAEQFLKEIEK